MADRYTGWPSKPFGSSMRHSVGTSYFMPRGRVLEPAGLRGREHRRVDSVSRWRLRDVVVDRGKRGGAERGDGVGHPTGAVCDAAAVRQLEDNLGAGVARDPLPERARGRTRDRVFDESDRNMESIRHAARESGFQGTWTGTSMSIDGARISSAGARRLTPLSGGRTPGPHGCGSHAVSPRCSRPQARADGHDRSSPGGD
jgi:hypothetical protein